MADEEYDVDVRITAQDKTKAAIGGAQARMLKLQQSTMAATRGIRNMVGATVGLAGAYLGIRALTGGFQMLATSSFEYASSLAKQQTGLSAILAATQPMFAGIADGAQRMNAAGEVGGAIFRQLQNDALKSVATSQELFGVYSSIAGPLAGAGAKLSEIRKITNDTISAASVLGVDFGQASRDIMLMSSGAAGMDTMLFRMLKSTGRITESTQEWNQMLPEKRLARIQEALSGFAPAAAQFEKTLPGISSSFVDFMQRFRASFMGGPLEGFRKMLVRMVGIFQKNQDTILALLTTAGDRFGQYLEPMFQGIGNITEYFLANWDTIALKIEQTWLNIKSWGEFAFDKFQKFAPTLKVAGGMALANKLTGGAMASKAGGFATDKIAAGAGWVAEVVKDLMTLGLGFKVVVPILAIVVGLVAAIADNWDSVLLVVMPVGAFLQDIFVTLWGTLQALFSAVWPLVKIIGITLLGALVLVGGTIIALARMFWPVFKMILEGWTLIFTYLGQALDWVYGILQKTFEGIAKFMGGVLDIGYGVNAPKEAAEQASGGFMSGFMDDFLKNFGDFGKQKGEDENLLMNAEASNNAKSKKIVHNDFRGSKIAVKQDFRDQDPDRVWDMMTEGLSKAADQRITSKLTPDFTR